jgi:AraC family transcriptional regulator
LNAKAPKGIFEGSVEIDAIVFATESVHIGAFRCPIRHPSFSDSGPIRNHCFVFPRTPVVIQHRDDRAFAADPTLVTMYNKGQEYRRRPLSPDGDRCDWYAVTPEILRDALGEYDARAADDDEHPIRFSFAPSDAGTYLLQREVFTAALGAKADHALAIEEAVLELLDRVLRSAYAHASRRRHDAAGRCASDLAHDACEVLGRRFAEPLALADIARDVGASLYHLCRAFRRTTGTTIHEYRNQLRLRSALDRLELRDCDLSQLALELGYSSHSHFTASFRRAFRVTPSNARRHISARS